MKDKIYRTKKLTWALCPPPYKDDFTYITYTVQISMYVHSFHLQLFPLIKNKMTVNIFVYQVKQKA